MPIRKPALHDRVAVLRDIPEARLRRGNFGKVVGMNDEPDPVLVEFYDSKGKVTTMPWLAIDDLLVLLEPKPRAE